MNQSAVGKPQNRCFIVLGSCAFPNEAIDELFVFSCQLRGDAVPKQADLGNDLIRGVFGKVLLISGKDSLLYLTDLIKILIFRKALHRFRHAAYKIVLLERINVGLLKARDHWIILLAEQLCKTLLTGGHQKLLERERE